MKNGTKSGTRQSTEQKINQTTLWLESFTVWSTLFLEENSHMSNKWNVPVSLEMEVRKRDTKCVYCGIEFGSIESSRKSDASWEHIINDAKIITRENIALCCCACNASKGAKKLSDWLQSNYCLEHNITLQTVSPIVKNAIQNGQ